MEHKKVLETINQARGTVILSLYYLAAQIESQVLMDLLMDLETDSLIELFPEIKESNMYQHVDQLIEEDIKEFLFDYNKLGFIAVTNHPIHSNFTFKPDGEFESCSYSHSACYESYVYAETIAELIEKVEERAEKWWQHDLEKAKDHLLKTQGDSLMSKAKQFISDTLSN